MEKILRDKTASLQTGFLKNSTLFGKNSGKKECF